MNDEMDDDGLDEEMGLGPDEVEAALSGLDMDMELDTQSRIFLQMREQNLELLKIASQVAGFGGGHPPLRPGDLKNAMKGIWEVYSEFYAWIDPEESEGDDEDMDE